MFFSKNISLSSQSINQAGFLSNIVQRVESYLERLNRILLLENSPKERYSQLFVFLKISMLIVCCVVSFCFIFSLPHTTPSRNRPATLLRVRYSSKALYKSMLDDEKKKKNIRKYQQTILMDLEQRLSQVKTYWVAETQK